MISGVNFIFETVVNYAATTYSYDVMVSNGSRGLIWPSASVSLSPAEGSRELQL